MADRRSHRVAPSRCPHCDAVHDAASSSTGDGPTPKAGDLTICIECAGICRFGPTLELERGPDLAELHARDRLLLERVIAAVKHVRSSPEDVAHEEAPRELYATMTVPQLVELRHAFERDVQHVRTDEGRTFIARRIALIDAELGRRIN